MVSHKGRNFEGDTMIGIKFDDTVTITESFYPPASIPNFMAEIGGILGLWLGIGTLQIFLHAFEFVDFLRSILKL